MSRLSADQRRRYARNISVESIGADGQLRLLNSSVFVLGCGALGSVAATYLAGAGVGRIVIADFDTIDMSNLQRQTHYGESDAGQPKVAVLAKRLREINSEITVVEVNALVNRDEARRLFADCDFIVDASDNPDTKYMIDSVCAEIGKPYAIGGVLGMNGQVMTHVEGSARYSDFFAESAGAGYTPCSIGGVIGPVAGVVGSLEALEAIKYLAGCDGLLTDRLLIIDGASLQMTTLSI